MNKAKRHLPERTPSPTRSTSLDVHKPWKNEVLPLIFLAISIRYIDIRSRFT